MNGGQPVNCSYMCHEPFFESCCVGDEQTSLPERGRAFGVRKALWTFTDILKQPSLRPFTIATPKTAH